ncbi:predicted protein [Uncinocarpus reesii 1704]|uniref:Uncharacterized protein n=1 Tax=Uncinocarpus reesii (strain UAMH 1704) TaxID=336963 RepID=C4JRT3_UNCRE|nr:uncharacterized protein UREG_05172 [Uncinocarpus reesii 1704]EEP80330.1 predicted protein [Uncinocarpus reesii 1704]
MTPIQGSLRQGIFTLRSLQRRSLSTLPGHPHIFVFPSRISPSAHTLSLLPTEPPTPELAIGATSKLPPSPDSFVENSRFLEILQSVISKHAHEDPEVKSQAQVMASTAGANLGSGGVFFSPQPQRRRPAYGGGGGAGGDSSGGASGQGGAGSGGRGGFIHVSDGRNPPDYGRIAWPEDIFGSLEVDGNGNIEGTGNYQPSGMASLIDDIVRPGLVLSEI